MYPSEYLYSREHEWVKVDDDVCTVGSGMRVGRGLHVGLLSLVGRTGGFVTAQLGSSRIGQGALVGRPVLGVRPGSSRVATTTRAG